MALDCPAEGSFATVGLIPPGKRLRVNASIGPAGYIKVSVSLVGAEEPLAGRDFGDADPLVGDELNMPVTWRGQELLNHGGAPIVLRFEMRGARLFGVTFA